MRANSQLAYNIRQLKLMLDSISRFEEMKIDLCSLQSTLEFLFGNVEKKESNWSRVFLNEIANLETINAGIPKNVKIDKDSIVNKTVNTLKGVIEDYMKKCLKDTELYTLESASVLDQRWLLCPKCLEAWESESRHPVVICPKCDSIFQNPLYNKVY